jgi:hypothetical protein
MRRQRPLDVKLLAKEIAAELRAKYDLNTRPCSMKTAKALGLDVPTSILLSADEWLIFGLNRNGRRVRHGRKCSHRLQCSSP